MRTCIPAVGTGFPAPPAAAFWIEAESPRMTMRCFPSAEMRQPFTPEATSFSCRFSSVRSKRWIEAPARHPPLNGQRS